MIDVLGGLGMLALFTFCGAILTQLLSVLMPQRSADSKAVATVATAAIVLPQLAVCFLAATLGGALADTSSSEDANLVLAAVLDLVLIGWALAVTRAGTRALLQLLGRPVADTSPRGAEVTLPTESEALSGDPTHRHSRLRAD